MANIAKDVDTGNDTSTATEGRGSPTARATNDGLAERVSRLEGRLDEMEHTRRLIEHQIALAAVASGRQLLRLLRVRLAARGPTGTEAETLCVEHVDQVHKEFVALYPDLSRVEVAA